MLVYNHYLAMITAVAKGVSHTQLYAIAQKPLPHLLWHLARTVAIYYKAYTHALTRFTAE
jgi:hypothetical protein